MRATERAAASLLRVEDRPSPRIEPLARLLLRAEGVASSAIEGVRAPAELVAVAEVDPGAVDDTSAWVADNLAVVDAAQAHARSNASLTARDLHRWHSRLMAHGGLAEEHVGRYRRVQDWIGGPTPRQAAYVPPLPEYVGPLMRDLLRVANTATLDSVTLAAVVHGQFEAIHPYGDGNGRLGRVLIGWVLVRRTGIAVPPPVSVAVAADAAARRLAERLPEHLVVTAPIVAELLGISGPTARGAVEALAARGILEPLELRPVRPGRPARWWMAAELVAVVGRRSP